MNLVTLGMVILGGLVAVWLLGGILSRVSGLLLVLAGALGVALEHNANGILVFVIGGLLWLAGHWHYALRQQEYKSPLARHIFCRWAPAWLDSARNWALPVVDAEPTDPERRPR